MDNCPEANIAQESPNTDSSTSILLVSENHVLVMNEKESLTALPFDNEEGVENIIIQIVADSSEPCPTTKASETTSQNSCIQDEFVSNTLHINNKIDFKEDDHPLTTTNKTDTPKQRRKHKKVIIDLEKVPTDDSVPAKSKLQTYARKKQIVASGNSSSSITTSTKLYKKITVPSKVEKTTERNVFDFYDEEDEKLKMEQEKKEQELKEIKERTCRYCQKLFNDPIDVLRHKREAHKTNKIIMSEAQIQPYLNLENRVNCPLCFKKVCPYGFKSVYVKHLMTHCENYSFSCKVCGMKFRRKDHLQNHEKRHIIPPKDKA